jgi:hypothetical protein
MRRNLGNLLCIPLAAALLSGAALKLLPVPFAWIGCAWAAAGFVLAAAARRGPRVALVISSCGALAVGVAECILALWSPPPVERSIEPHYAREDSLLGWRPAPGHVSRATAVVRGDTIFDVTYTTDSAGRRLPPPEGAGEPAGCALFFTDSFTFGEGVRDEEAYPYRVGVRTGGRYRVVKYAAPGYGAEHLLARVEQGDLANGEPCRPTHLFYLAIPHHVLRAAGRTPYSERSPRYELDRRGVLVYRGTPRLTPPPPGRIAALRRRIAEQLRKSRLVRAAAAREPRPTADDLRLYLAIVGRSSRLLAERFPTAEFHVLAWSLHASRAGGRERFLEGLRAVAANVHEIEEALPGYGEDSAPYELHPRDRHPNAAAHDLIARYVVERILEP